HAAPRCPRFLDPCSLKLGRNIFSLLIRGLDESLQFLETVTGEKFGAGAVDLLSWSLGNECRRRRRHRRRCRASTRGRWMCDTPIRIARFWRAKPMPIGNPCSRQRSSANHAAWSDVHRDRSAADAATQPAFREIQADAWNYLE